MVTAEFTDSNGVYIEELEVVEEQGYVELCVSLKEGTTERDLSVFASLESQTATGELGY